MFEVHIPWKVPPTLSSYNFFVVDVFVTLEDIMMYIIIVFFVNPLGMCVTPLQDV